MVHDPREFARSGRRAARARRAGDRSTVRHEIAWLRHALQVERESTDGEAREFGGCAVAGLGAQAWRDAFADALEQ